MNIIDKIQNEWQTIFIDSYNGWIYLGLFFGSILLMYLSFLYKKKNIIGRTIFVLSPIVIFGAFIKIVWLMPISFGIIFLLLLFVSLIIYTPKGLIKMYTQEKLPKPFWVKNNTKIVDDNVELFLIENEKQQQLTITVKDLISFLKSEKKQRNIKSFKQLLLWFLILNIVIVIIAIIIVRVKN